MSQDQLQLPSRTNRIRAVVLMLPYFSCTTADFEVKYLLSKVTVGVLVNTSNRPDFLNSKLGYYYFIIIYVFSVARQMNELSQLKTNIRWDSHLKYSSSSQFLEKFARHQCLKFKIISV